MKPWDREMDLFRLMVATKNDPAPTGVAVDMIDLVNRNRWWGIESSLIAVLWREQAT